MIDRKQQRCCKSHMERGDTQLIDLALDATDYGFLAAARHFCVSFSDPSSDTWVMALLTAERFFPGSHCSETMRRALSVVQEMRTSRRSMFHFSNPFCQGCAAIVTQDERHLLQLIQFARQGRKSAMASSALLLCEGHDTRRIIMAAEWFSEIAGTARRKEVTV